MDVLVTGGNGQVGTILRGALEQHGDYDVTYLDVSEHPDRDTYIADITDIEAIRPAFEDKDAVIHLAYIRSPLLFFRNKTLQWSEPLMANLKGTCNVIEAAIDAGLSKFIYASSNHAVGRFEEEHAPELYFDDSPSTLQPDTPVRPDSMYGVSKVFAEAVGRFAAEVHELRCYALRIGALRGDPYDHPYGDAERGVARGDWERGDEDYELQVARMKSMWQSQRDFVQMVDLCLQDDAVSFEVFYGVSVTDGGWFSIQNAREVLGYEPMDDASAWDGPPT